MIGHLRLKFTQTVDIFSILPSLLILYFQLKTAFQKHPLTWLGAFFGIFSSIAFSFSLLFSIFAP